MTIRGHIHELKMKLLICVFVFITFFILFYIKSDIVFNAIMSIGSKCGYRFSYLSPYETLIQVIRCCCICSLFASSPIIVYEIVSYITPAFDKKAHKAIVLCTIISFILFCLGVLFCIQILLPFVYTYMYNYSGNYDISSNVSIEKYVSSFTSIVVILGIIFELPLVSGCLGKIGLISPSAMLRSIRPVTLIILIVSAIITPPDLISMIIVALPIFVIYVLSILICRILYKTRE